MIYALMPALGRQRQADLCVSQASQGWAEKPCLNHERKLFFANRKQQKYPKMEKASVSFAKCCTNVAHWQDLLPIQKLGKSMLHGRAGALYTFITLATLGQASNQAMSSPSLLWSLTALQPAWSPRFWSSKWVYEKPSSDILALFDGNILTTNLLLVYIVYWKGMDWPEGPRLSEPVTSQLIPVFTHILVLSKDP